MGSLQQDDFRSLLEKGKSKTNGTENNPKHEDDEEFEAKETKPKEKKTKKSFLKYKQKLAEKQEKVTKYRDRAAERRKGLNLDYENGMDSLVQIDAEHSKFLGGDLEHTHLVKGLDYALLSKLKVDAEKLKKSAENAGISIPFTIPSNNKKKTETEVEFKTRLGRAVYDVLMYDKQNQTTQLFLPGRTIYQFDLNLTVIEGIPMRIQRSKEDCSPIESNLRNEDANSGILEKLHQITVLRNQHGTQKLRRRKKKMEQKQQEEELARNNKINEQSKNKLTSTAPPLFVEEDIFPDIFEGIPQRKNDSATSMVHEDQNITKRGAQEGKGYFSHLRATTQEEKDEKHEIQINEAWNERVRLSNTMRKVNSNHHEDHNDVEEDDDVIQEKMTAMNNGDSYSECFPDYQGMEVVCDSESDDDDEKKKESVDGSENTSKRKQKQSRNKAKMRKLDGELTKINTILKSDKFKKNTQSTQ